MSKQSKYDDEFKKQALRLMKEVGAAEAAKQLGITRYQVYDWSKQAKEGKITVSNDEKDIGSALTTKEEIKLLRERNRALEKQIKRYQEENDFLREASAFFAASHPKLRKMRDSNSSQ